MGVAADNKPRNTTNTFTATDVLDLLVTYRQASWEQSLEAGDMNDLPSLLISSEIEAGNLNALRVFHRAWEIGKRQIGQVVGPVAREPIPAALRESILQELTLVANTQASSYVPFATRENLNLKKRIIDEDLGDLAAFSGVMAIPACPTINALLAEATNLRIQEFQNFRIRRLSATYTEWKRRPLRK